MASKFQGLVTEWRLRPRDVADLLEALALAEERLPSLAAALVKASEAARAERLLARLPALRAALLEARDAALPAQVRTACTRCGVVRWLERDAVGAVHCYRGRFMPQAAPDRVAEALAVTKAVDPIGFIPPGSRYSDHPGEE